jgi:hypothetical protein
VTRLKKRQPVKTKKPKRKAPAKTRWAAG